jgi:hypothetical protein
VWETFIGSESLKKGRQRYEEFEVQAEEGLGGAA